jgi:beta-glucanase (GH16 family)
MKRLGTRLSIIEFCLAAILFVTLCFLYSVNAAPPPGKSWKLIWNDEFNGTRIDESKWTWFLGWSGPAYREAYYTTEDAYLKDGNLVFRVRKEGNRYKTSWLTTKDKFRHKYGYWEIRCKFTEMKAKGCWVAFWLFANNDVVYDGDPRNGCEIDIMEYAWMDDRTNHAIHWGRHRSDSVSHIEQIPGLREGFHTFGLEWTKDEYIFYIDDKKIWRTGKGVSQAEQTLFLSVEIEAGNWGDGGDIRDHTDLLPNYWIIDYVRIYDVPERSNHIPHPRACFQEF